MLNSKVKVTNKWEVVRPGSPDLKSKLKSTKVSFFNKLILRILLLKLAGSILRKVRKKINLN